MTGKKSIPLIKQVLIKKLKRNIMTQGGRPQVQPELLQQEIVNKTIDFEGGIKSFGEYINDFAEMIHEERYQKTLRALLSPLISTLETMSFHIDQFLIANDPVLNPLIRDWVNDSLNDLREFGDKMNEGNIIARFDELIRRQHFVNLKESQVRNAINFAAQLHDDVPMDTSSESNGSPDNIPSPIVSSDHVKPDLSSDSNGSPANVPSPNV